MRGLSKEFKVKILKTLVLALWAVTSVAQTNFEERPILKASLTKADGSVSQAVKSFLVMNENVETQEISSFTWIDQIAVRCQVATRCPGGPMGIAARLQVESITTDSCGSMIYKARDTARYHDAMKIEVTDHATRLCDDYRPYRWEVRQQVREVREFVGNPYSVLP